MSEGSAAEPTDASPAGSAAERDPDLLAALLAHAREERDENYRQLLEAQEWINTVLANPVYRGLRGAKRLVRPRSSADEPQPASVSAPPVREHLPVPDFDTVLIDATALDESTRSGIARVTIRVFAEIHRASGGRAQLVFPVAGRLRRDPQLERAVLGELPERPAAENPDIVTVTPGLFSAGIAPGPVAPSWWEAVDNYRRHGGRYVQVVHDLLPITVPEFFDVNMRGYFPQWLAHVTDQADGILTDSLATADELLRWWDESQPTRRPPVAVLPLGSELPNTPADTDGGTHAEEGTGGETDGAHVLIVGTIEPRKGVDAVLAAVPDLTQGQPPVRITFVGARGWISPTVLADLEHTVATNPAVQWLQRVDDAQLRHLYRSSQLLLAPSRGEGYGLPIVEAMQHGVAVLARDLPVFREIGGDDARYFSHDSDLAAAVRAALADPIAPRSPAQLPTWAGTAAVVLATLARLADSS